MAGGRWMWEKSCPTACPWKAPLLYPTNPHVQCTEFRVGGQNTHLFHATPFKETHRRAEGLCGVPSHTCPQRVASFSQASSSGPGGPEKPFGHSP